MSTPDCAVCGRELSGDGHCRTEMCPRFDATPEVSCTYVNREGNCDANDGDPCDSCVAEQEAELAYWRGRWQVASPEEKDPDKYRAEMREAGRGHLVRR